ncbi:MAG: hypothetical protein HN379_07075 [Desulfobacteraceae bacterium]|jgi:hypothetical protein|nr:hypothetical protein [Desulfobacteraceae bacterium]
MTIIPILKQFYLKKLKNKITSTINIYNDENIFELDETGMFLKTPVQLKGEPPVLTANGAKSDAQNAIDFHAGLYQLQPAQASDERLWAALTHSYYWEYTRDRWPMSGDIEKRKNNILSHWFVGGGKGGLRRNAIARLWWGGFLTHAPWLKDDELSVFKQEDPYYYTKTLFSYQDIYQGLIERDYGSNLRPRIVLLDIFEETLPIAKFPTKFITSYLKQVNLVCSYNNLSGLSIDNLHSMLSKMANELITNF